MCLVVPCNKSSNIISCFPNSKMIKCERLSFASSHLQHYTDLIFCIRNIKFHGKALHFYDLSVDARRKLCSGCLAAGSFKRGVLTPLIVVIIFPPLLSEILHRIILSFKCHRSDWMPLRIFGQTNGGALFKLELYLVNGWKKKLATFSKTMNVYRSNIFHAFSQCNSANI